MSSGEVASIPCNLCGGTDVSVLSRRSRSGQPLRTVACRACGLVWSDPRPHDARRFYEDDYRLAYKGTFEPRPKHVLRAGRVALARLRRIEPYLAPRMRVLDVGSGGGEFAYLLQTLGHEVVGVEPNRGYAEYAARQYGLRVERGFVDDVALPPQGFDLITIWHVLEHTQDPGAVLARLRAALRPGGTLVVEVPNVEATCQSPRGTFHEAHLYNFNTATLERLGALAGLQAVASTLSADGGNITAVFRLGAQAASDNVSRTLPGNHDRVAEIVRRHAARPYGLTAHPYRRAANRLGQAVRERVALIGAPRGRALLDRVYANAQGGTPAGLSRWAALATTLAVLYALAWALEETLLDLVLPSWGWTEGEALIPYLLATTLSIVVALSTVGGRLGSGHQLALLTAALPIFALPAFC